MPNVLAVAVAPVWCATYINVPDAEPLPAEAPLPKILLFEYIELVLTVPPKPTLSAMSSFGCPLLSSRDDTMTVRSVYVCGMLENVTLAVFALSVVVTSFVIVSMLILRTSL